MTLTKISKQNHYNHSKHSRWWLSIDPFYLLSVSCHHFLGKIVEWLPIALFTVLNSELALFYTDLVNPVFYSQLERRKNNSCLTQGHLCENECNKLVQNLKLACWLHFLQQLFTLPIYFIKNITECERLKWKSYPFTMDYNDDIAYKNLFGAVNNMTKTILKNISPLIS